MQSGHLRPAEGALREVGRTVNQEADMKPQGSSRTVVADAATLAMTACIAEKVLAWANERI